MSRAPSPLAEARDQLRPLLAPLVVALTLLLACTGLYTAAYQDPKPHDVPLGVVGPPARSAELQVALDRAAPGGFDVRPYADEASARLDLLDTAVQGVLLTKGHGLRALVTGAYGKAPTDAVRVAFEKVAAASRSPLAVQDVAPLPANDSRGLSSVFVVFGLLTPALSFGALLAVLGTGLAARARWLGLIGFAATGGMLSALTADGLVGALSGAFWPLAGVTALVILGVSGAVHGLVRSLGLPGLLLAVLGFLVLGQASSGGAVTPLLVPDALGAVSGWLPPGAGVAAVRNVVYFDGAAIAGPLVLLAGWAVAGLALDLVGRGHPGWAVGLPHPSTPSPRGALT
jgi:hypothetical protein